jgi:predicted O-methyltransferase YrrM
MTKEEIQQIINNYASESFPYTDNYEHRFEKVSSGIMYAFIRERKPTAVLEIGSSHGGSTSVIMSALIKNNQPFTFISSEIADDLRHEAKQNVFNENGRFPVMVGDITKNIDAIPEVLDFVFVDTNHDLPVTQWILENIVPRIKIGGMYCMHDWAVWHEGDQIKSKGDGNDWNETGFLMDLIKTNQFPFKEVFWTYKVTGEQESGFWEKI